MSTEDKLREFLNIDEGLENDGTDYLLYKALDALIDDLTPNEKKEVEMAFEGVSPAVIERPATSPDHNGELTLVIDPDEGGPDEAAAEMALKRT